MTLVVLYAVMFATVTIASWMLAMRKKEYGPIATATASVLVGALWPLVLLTGAYLLVRDRDKENQ